MSDGTEQFYNEIKELAQELKTLTSVQSETNRLLTKVVTENEHRDNRLDKQEMTLADIAAEVSELKDLRIKDREEYKPVWDAAKKSQDNHSEFRKNGMWLAILFFALVITNSISTGIIKLPFQGAKHSETP